MCVKQRPGTLHNIRYTQNVYSCFPEYGNYLNDLQKNLKMAKTRFWGRFEPDSGFLFKEMAKFAIFDFENPDACSKRPQNRVLAIF